MEDRKKVENRLKHSYFIVGGGAWQHLWDRDSNQSIGFQSNESETQIPTQEDLRSSIRPELLKRFRSEITVMTPMTKNDYQVAMKAISSKLSAFHRESFVYYFNERIEEAVEQKLGMRYFEEVLSKTLTQPICDLEEEKQTNTIEISP